jgi:arylesterase / paraoxonase
MTGTLGLTVLVGLLAVSLIRLTPVGNLIGKVTIENPLELYSNQTGINNYKCFVNDIVNACEDVKIHFDSGTAFLACGDPAQRQFYYPPSCALDESRRTDFREKFFKYDIDSNSTTELKVVNYDGDIITHGIDVISDGTDRVRLLAVNHGRPVDSILVMSHELGTEKLEVLKEVKHPNIKTANGVSQYNSSAFFITNDHYFPKGLGRRVEDYFGPWSWASDVQFCTFDDATTTCNRVLGPYPGANGIYYYHEHNELWISDSKDAMAYGYKVFDDGFGGISFSLIRKIILGAAPDNVNPDPLTGDLLYAIFPEKEHVQDYVKNSPRLGKEYLVPSASLRLVRSNNFTPQLVYWDDGSVLSYMTAMAIDPGRQVLIGGGVLQYGGSAVCYL